jgi:hypothetical protein
MRKARLVLDWNVGTRDASPLRSERWHYARRQLQPLGGALERDYLACRAPSALPTAGTAVVSSTDGWPRLLAGSGGGRRGQGKGTKGGPHVAGFR